MLCHSVCSWRWPFLSRQRRLVARLKLATGWPEGVERTSGSRPRLPIRITLLTMVVGPPLRGDEVRYHSDSGRPAGMPGAEAPAPRGTPPHGHHLQEDGNGGADLDDAPGSPAGGL